MAGSEGLPLVAIDGIDDVPEEPASLSEGLRLDKAGMVPPAVEMSEVPVYTAEAHRGKTGRARTS